MFRCALKNEGWACSVHLRSLYARMPHHIFRVDTLTPKPFSGVPVTVCVLEEPKERAWMRDVSLASGTRESAFLLKKSPNRFHLRTMAGGTEVELSALATLGAAHALYYHGLAEDHRPIAFFTHGGNIPASKTDGRIDVTFPQMLLEELTEPPEEILQGVDPAPEFVGRRGEDYLVQLSSESLLRTLRPDFRFLRAMGMRGLILTSTSNGSTGADFLSRTFYISESHEDDPIASFAHCLLAPFWLAKLAKGTLRGGRMGRPGIMELEVEVDRIKLTGDAVTIFSGELNI